MRANNQSFSLWTRFFPDMLLRRVARTLQGLSVPVDGRAAVAFSGGCDSAALLGVARELFSKRVTAVTVDHRLRPESSREAEEAGRLAQRLGVPHRIVPVQWAELPTSAIQKRARNARYHALLRYCEQHSVDTLLLGHHKDDQIETFLDRLSNESGLDGLACMEGVLLIQDNPPVRVVRPLLDVTKRELQDYCEENAILWLEDPTNESDTYFRNRIRKVLQANQWLGAPTAQLIARVQHIRVDMQQKVSSACDKLVSIERKHGFATVNLPHFRQLPPPVGKRLLLSLLHHIGGHTNTVCNTPLNSCYDYLVAMETRPNKAASLAHCNMALIDSAQFMVARQLPRTTERTLTPIVLGEPLLWGNRFRVTLSPTPKGRHAHNPLVAYSVRHMLETDYIVARKGLRRRKSARLPPLLARGGLPVVVDATGRIVAAPHLGYLDVKFGVTCSVTFDPAVPLHNSVSFHSQIV